MPSEPTVRVPMTRTLRDRLAADIAFWPGPDGLDHLQPLVAAYDAAVARPAEPERTVRWCETHGRVAKLGDGCGPRWADELETCRVSTRRVSGVVADG